MRATEAQIEAWRQAHGTVFEYRAQKAGCEPLYGYFKTISPVVLDAYEAARKRSNLAADEVVISNCWLGGDEALRTEDDYKLGLRDWLGYLLVKVEGEMSEL